MNDEQLIAALREVDELERDVTEWEADFINDVAFGRGFLAMAGLTDRQREKAEEIVGRYLPSQPS